MSYPPLDITPVWARFNESLIALVDRIPDDQMNWSPKPELWNFRGILLHIADARDNWMRDQIKDGEEPPNVWLNVRSKQEVQDAYRRTWDRVARFLSDESLLDSQYDDYAGRVSGHWIAFHLLQHDIHHRADIFHYLALLGVDTGDVGTP